MDIIIYHNPNCGTSRKVLGLIRDAGTEPQVIEYLKTPPTRTTLVDLIERAGVPPHQLLRTKEALASELGLTDESISDGRLIDAMIANPILINRPIVVTPAGVKLCRPAEEVLDLLPAEPR